MQIVRAKNLLRPQCTWQVVTNKSKSSITSMSADDETSAKCSQPERRRVPRTTEPGGYSNAPSTPPGHQTVDYTCITLYVNSGLLIHWQTESTDLPITKST